MKRIAQLMFVFCFALTACFEDGEDGENGPQGDPGEKGEQGEMGEKGDDGVPGIVFSDWIDINWNVLDEDDEKQASIADPAINKEFIENSGIVLMYLRLISFEFNTTIAVPLPFLNGDENFYFFFGEFGDAPFTERICRMVFYSP